MKVIPEVSTPALPETQINLDVNVIAMICGLGIVVCVCLATSGLPVTPLRSFLSDERKCRGKACRRLAPNSHPEAAWPCQLSGMNGPEQTWPEVKK